MMHCWERATPTFPYANDPVTSVYPRWPVAVPVYLATPVRLYSGLLPCEPWPATNDYDITSRAGRVQLLADNVESTKLTT